MDTGITTAVSLLQLLSSYPSLRGKGVLQKVAGISERALKGRVSWNPGATLSEEESLRARQLAETLEKATQVMGAGWCRGVDGAAGHGARWDGAA